MVWSFPHTTLWVDPGPGALVRALSARPPVDPSKVDHLLLTHRHLDHAGDANAVVEAMTGGGFKPRGALWAPADALGEEPVVFTYARRFLEEVHTVAPGTDYRLAVDVVLQLPIAHRHGVETYGYRLTVSTPGTPNFVACHIVDTLMFEGLAQAYRGCDLLIVNTTRLKGGDPGILHLGVDDATQLIAAIRPKLALLTHFGMQVVGAKPDRVAARVQEETGVATHAAHDGLRVPLPPSSIEPTRGENDKDQGSPESP